jgi:hypothetical protein
MNLTKTNLVRDEVVRQLCEWKEEVDLRAFGATCPMPGCGSLVITYEPEDSLNGAVHPAGATWEFVCPDCGSEFTAPRGDLLFQSVPREWLFSEVHCA